MESPDSGVKITYLPPNQIFRNDFLETAFTKSQSIPDPEIAGLTLGLSINSIHYFEDGNGRTARMAYALLKKGYDGSKEDQLYYSSLLENIKGRQILDPNPASTLLRYRVCQEMLNSAAEHTGYANLLDKQMPIYVSGGYSSSRDPTGLRVNKEINTEGRNHLYDILENSGMTAVSLMYAFMPEQVRNFIRKSPVGTHGFVDGDEFIPTLTMKDIYRWRHTSEAATMNYVTEIINVADRPDIERIAESYR